ncbi:MAG: hypothetical protein FWD87_09350 [Spirochaetaceae bacterium]|nr:hypothetical protein [Spirochaetaceae bacterium]
MKKIAVVILFFLINSMVFASGGFDHLLPEEYSPDEFPLVLRDIRRAQIILAGSYPFSVLFARIGLDLYDFTANGFDTRFAPAMFGGSATVDRSSADVNKVLLTALGISIGVATLDFFIGKAKARGKRNNANQQTVQSRQSQPAGNTDR